LLSPYVGSQAPISHRLHAAPKKRLQFAGGRYRA
jgi:hypothetical protein